MTGDAHGKYKDFVDDIKEVARTENIQREVVVEKKTGQPRQAGASTAEGAYIKKFRALAERNLFVFAKGVMRRQYLTPSLHLPICQFLQKAPPFRKLLLLPRDHAKTSIVSHCLPLHIIIQSPENNIYFPGLHGGECRILLSGETAARACGNLRVIRAAFEDNDLLRALWPAVCWENPKRQARKWNDEEIICPRETEYPDSTIKAIGVGGAITGARPNVIIKDDLISVEAANSTVVMQSAIDWHIASRALMDEYEKASGLESLEFIIGTRWAVYDLYQYIIDEDPSVEIVLRSILEEGKPIWPERFDAKRIEQLKKEFGSMFWLLYMNSAANPDLTDFDMEMVRFFGISGRHIRFEEDERDAALAEKLKKEPAPIHVPYGAPLNKHTWAGILGRGRGEYFRLKVNR